MEALSRVAKMGEFDTRSQQTMAINTEWGNFDQNLEYLPDTGYDREMDAASVNPGFEMFEKRVAGMYLGELLRLAILSLVGRPDSELFLGTTISQTSKLYLPWSLDSSIVSYLAKDTSNDLFASRVQIEGLLGIAPVDFKSAWAVRTIAHAIGRRSARLSAVAIGAILVQTGSVHRNLENNERIGVGVDGSLVELYPDFVTEIRCALRCIPQVGETGEANVEITVAKDGSGVGAALAAYVASKADL
jgi:hexokinase